jgi:hypothetical protein
MVAPRSSLQHVTEYQITYWRDLPSMVVAREGDDVTKAPLAARFQEAIDEAAMRLGEVDSDAYLAGWRRDEWTAADGSPAEVADRAVAELESTWTPEAVEEFLAGLGADAGQGDPR